jgi:methionyl-tRNA formyltransferase
MAAMGADLLAETLDRVAAGDLVPQPQDNTASCYAAMLKKDDGIINWHSDARTIHNLVRGLAVWPGACTVIGDQVVKIFRTSVGDGTGEPGTVLQTAKGQFEVACQTGSLFLHELQLAGKKRLDCTSFLAGCPVSVGTLLGSHPSGDLPL